MLIDDFRRFQQGRSREGAWIEIDLKQVPKEKPGAVAPVRERGLKYQKKTIKK